MKMSKSIKDYKDAMDSIRISDSFYKRTETLLNELPEAKIEKNTFRIDKKISAGIMAAAACLICFIGVRTVLNVRQDNIGSVSSTDLTEITLEVTESTSVPEMIDNIGEKDAADEMLPDDDMLMFEDEQEQQKAEEEIDKAKSNAAPLSHEGKEISAPSGGQNAIPERSGEEPLTSGYPDITVNGTDNIPPITDIDPENITVEITPYFDMDNITSGEGSVNKHGTECRELIELICGSAESSRKISNSSFRSIFSVQITDSSTGAVFYSIYITDSSTMIITAHNSDGQQRHSFELSSNSYGEIKHILFLMFGTEANHELFENLVSGK